MARLGKREREFKRTTIKGNLANLAGLERPTMAVRDKRGSIQVIKGASSSLDTNSIMVRTHSVGVHIGSNIKGHSGSAVVLPPIKNNAKMADGRPCYVAKRR